MSELQQDAEPVVHFILCHLRRVRDWRKPRGRNHPLVNVLFMGLCAVVCGAQGFKEMAHFARRKRSFFARYLCLDSGLPGTDTFRRTFGALSPHVLEELLRQVGEVLARAAAPFGPRPQPQHACDGKAVRGAVHHEGRGGVLHLLHAWVSDVQLLVGQVAVAGSPGEVKALPALLGTLDLEGSVVTVDANGTTLEVARACVDAGADYVLALKGNRSTLHAFVFTLFVLKHWRGGLPQSGTRHFASEEKGHGRRELREAWAMDIARWPCDWPGLRSAVLMRRTRTRPGKPAQVQWHLYVSSLPAHAARLARTVRRHWSVENRLHWVLDVQMGEDRRQVRHQRAAENLALVSRTALALLRHDTTVKAGIALKRKDAGWDDDYLAHLVTARVA
jgi:predicted transposase YbfD/YdcC